MLPTLRAAKQERQSNAYSSSDGAEDFSFIKIKFRDCISFRWGSKGKPILETAPHHTLTFTLTKVVLLGIKTLANLTVDYMEMQSKVNIDLRLKFYFDSQEIK
jgi:hypothetical protein